MLTVSQPWTKARTNRCSFIVYFPYLFRYPRKINKNSSLVLLCSRTKYPRNFGPIPPFPARCLQLTLRLDRITHKPLLRSLGRVAQAAKLRDKFFSCNIPNLHEPQQSRPATLISQVTHTHIHFWYKPFKMNPPQRKEPSTSADSRTSTYNDSHTAENGASWLSTLLSDANLRKVQGKPLITVCACVHFAQGKALFDRYC